MAKRGYKLQEFKVHESDVNCLNVGKKSCRVFVTGGEDRKVNLWAIGRSTPLLSLTGHISSVQSVTFDSAEVLVLAGSSNGTIKLWDLEEAKIVRTHTGHKSDCSAVEFHPFGEFFASGSLDTDLKMWDIRKKGCIHTYKGHTRGIRTIKFTPDGRWVVTGGEDNVVKLWDLTAGKLLHDFKSHNGLIRCIDFHPHEFLLATGSTDRTVKFWDLETFELIGSAGPETTGVRSMIFHPDGRTLLCGLDESLKVFSWEPIKCHDFVEMGWTTLGDLGIYEGKLLGCSYCQSHVRVWIVDISLVGPYSVGIMTKTNALSELVYSHGSNHSVDPTGSSPICSIGPLDCGSATKEAISICITSSECCQGFLQGIDYASNMTAMDLTGSRKNTVSCHSAPSKFDSRFSSNKSALNSNTFRAGKATDSCPITPNRAKSSFLSKDISGESTTFSANSSLTLNKGSIMDANTLNDTQPSSKSISVPVIVPRDRLDQETAGSCRKVTAATETTHDTILCKPNHLQQKPSFADGCYKRQLIGPVCEPLSGIANDITGAGSNFCSRLKVKGEIASTGEQNHSSIENGAEKLERIISLEQPVGLQNKNGAESPCSSSETSSVKYVKGVAVQLGRTRSLVESWERRDKGSSSYPGSFTSFSDQVPGAENFSCMPKGQVQTSERDGTSTDDHVIPEILVQNHDVFINALKSRVTKLQVVRHFWEHNGMKGAINAVAKLPDHSVQVDVIGILKEKITLFTLDLFSCLLPLLAGLLNSKIERHIALCLELLLELGKIFGPVIFTTKSASLLVGVNPQAEQRLEHCNQCFKHLGRIKQILPSLIRRGGLVAKHAQELTLLLHDLLSTDAT